MIKVHFSTIWWIVDLISHLYKALKDISKFQMLEGKKTKRRGSQAFIFEQTEETLLQNESLCSLYKNKNYQSPVAKELESISEEPPKVVEAQRSRRGPDTLVQGLKSETRFIATYQVIFIQVFLV